MWTCEIIGEYVDLVKQRSLSFKGNYKTAPLTPCNKARSDQISRVQTVLIEQYSKNSFHEINGE